MSRRHWSATWNNPPEPYVIPELGEYTKGQVEKGDEGTIHWQLYCYFKTHLCLKTLKKRYGDNYHWEVARNINALSDYVCKEDTRLVGPFERGTPPAQGKRSDIVDAFAFARKYGVKRSIDEYPGPWIKYRSNLRALVDDTREVPQRVISLRPWQSYILEQLLECQSDRTIHWVRDRDGNSGKSVLASYLAANHMAAVVTGGKYSDLAYTYDYEPMVVFALARETDKEELLAAARFAENLKDGHVTSSKYESKTKFFKSPTVVFFSNTDPPYSSWSHNRLIEYDIQDGEVRKESKEEQAFRA